MELRASALRADAQRRLEVRYEGVMVGEFVADIVVEDLVLAEINAVESLNEARTAPCINDLAATGLHVCLLRTFGTQVDVKRIVGKSLPKSGISSSSLCPSVESAADSESHPPMTRAGQAEIGAG